ncbi:MAG TPA: hypothetical protein VJZ75_05135 [Candidatus Bathyarchaeia archaeon]|nr:hypothetical protein [Candidatus Bathyarchaeia archaeon]
MSKYSVFTLGLSGVASGLFHLYLANIPRMLGAGSSSTGLFFLLLGIFQLLFTALIISKYASRIVVMIGVAGFAFSILIFFIATMVQLPFGAPHPQLNNTFALATKVIELVFIVDCLDKLNPSRHA